MLILYLSPAPWLLALDLWSFTEEFPDSSNYLLQSLWVQASRKMGVFCCALSGPPIHLVCLQSLFS